MIKKLIALASVVLLVGTYVACAYDWESQKADGKRFFVNLNGSAPTAGQLSTNFVNSGDIVVDSQNLSVYIVTEPNAGKYVKIASNGLVSVTGGASNPTQQFVSDVVLTNVMLTVTDKNDIVFSTYTNLGLAVSYKTNAIVSGVLTNAP